MYTYLQIKSVDFKTYVGLIPSIYSYNSTPEIFCRVQNQ